MKTDSRPHPDVMAELQREPAVHAEQTGVEVEDGVATLAPATDVKSDIEAALRRTSIADAEKISVAVDGSDVTLSGTVRSWDERNVATNSAWGTPGVRNVVDMMTLAQGPSVGDAAAMAGCSSTR